MPNKKLSKASKDNLIKTLVAFTLIAAGAWGVNLRAG